MSSVIIQYAAAMTASTGPLPTLGGTAYDGDPERANLTDVTVLSRRIFTGPSGQNHPHGNKLVLREAPTKLKLSQRCRSYVLLSLIKISRRVRAAV